MRSDTFMIEFLKFKLKCIQDTSCSIFVSVFFCFKPNLNIWKKKLISILDLKNMKA